MSDNRPFPAVSLEQVILNRAKPSTHLAPQPDPASLDVHGQLDLLTHVAQDVVRDAGTEKWPVNLDRLRMALYEIGALEASDD